MNSELTELQRRVLHLAKVGRIRLYFLQDDKRAYVREQDLFELTPQQVEESDMELVGGGHSQAARAIEDALNELRGPVLQQLRARTGSVRSSAIVRNLREALAEEVSKEQLFCYLLDEEGRNTIKEILDTIPDGQVVWLERYKEEGT